MYFGAMIWFHTSTGVSGLSIFGVLLVESSSDLAMTRSQRSKWNGSPAGVAAV